MKILILGSEGMLGTALMSVFPDAVGFDKNELDITDPDAVQDALHEREPDFVVNAAGCTDVDGAEFNRDLANSVNGDAVGYIADACRDISAALVHFSTDYVFDGENPRGYNENDKPNPINAYGYSKLIGEKRIRKKLKNSFIVRTSWLFGPNGKNFVDTMLKLASERDKLQVVNDQIGKPTYTFDLARAVQKLITHDFDYGTYHITNENPVTWYDFAKEILPGKNIEPIASEQFPRPAKRPKCSILLNKKFPPLRRHQEALVEYLERRV